MSSQLALFDVPATAAKPAKAKRVPNYTCQLVRSGSVMYADGAVNSSVAACKAVSALLGDHMSGASQEEFWIITLDTKLNVIGTHQVTVGTLDASLVHPREVFKHAFLAAASAILLVHNHPSGNLTPSRQDRDVTDRLKKGGEVLGVHVVDHIICGHDGTSFNTLSLAEHG